MQVPAISDTIIAVSSGWRPAPVAIVRLSGPRAFELLARLGAGEPPRHRPGWTLAELALDADATLPATVFWFSAPRSYTGQDVVELHTVGSLPLVRELTARLIELGARRAMPGEFTARAFLAGRMDAPQVLGVLELMRCAQDSQARQAARLVRGMRQHALADCAEKLVALLARIEAGIDFVDEEDIRFVTPGEVRSVIDDVMRDLRSIAAEQDAERRASTPHVAIVGLPNAGKSTLFNALIGYERALVSPVLGTTRDVLCAEATVGSTRVVFQDCAGLGGDTHELELAMHVATERAAERADLVLWVHAADVAWSERETRVCSRVPPERLILVRSKADLAARRLRVPKEVAVSAAVDVVAFEPNPVTELRRLLADRLQAVSAGQPAILDGAELPAVLAAMARARDLVPDGAEEFSTPELVSLELREALDVLGSVDSRGLDEEVLRRVFTEFCVGK